MLFRKTPVRGNFMDKKGGGREFHDFPSKFVCLTIPKRFAEEPFCVSENFGYRKNLCIKVEGL